MSSSGSAAPIAPTDRESDVLARDESLVAVFERHAPHFNKLRNKAIRRVMARLITVEQAARMAGIPVAVLLRELNDALDAPVSAGHGANAIDGPPHEPPAVPRRQEEPARAERTHPSHAPVIELDVREDLRAGREPFSGIMAAVSALHPSDVLHLRATFQPVPLFTVMGTRGFAHEAREHAPDDWSVWFWRPDAEQFPPSVPGTSECDSPESSSARVARIDPHDPSIHWLDVRGLEPPEPLVLTLAALEALPDGHTLVHVNVRVPQFLIPMLGERGYACEVDESHADQVLVRIWRVT
jgi:uncharacterized protein (DUF2249 family)